MKKLNKTVSKILFSGILLSLLLLVGSCENWMSNDNFMEQIESEVHDANASLVNVYVRYANSRWGTTEPQGNTAMKVDVASKISAVTSDEYGFVKWAAFLTKDFPINKQHSNLIFVSEKNYEANYKGKELPETVVRFADPKSPNTNVTIYSPSNEVFIVPIVTKRPEVESSYPVENDKTVKNTFIEIYFTKAIDEESLIDEEGNLNFNVTSSSYMRQNDEDEDEDEEDDENSSGNDITDYFNYALKRNGKCLKLTLKEGKILDNNQNVTVILHEGLRDKYGFEMNGNDKFTFKTGTKSDSLAPIIQILVGGNGKTRLGDFNSYHNDDVLEGSATEASVKAPKDIESDEYTSAIVAQRVYDKLYLYVKSIDIIGADGNLTLDDKNQQEENVGYIGIAASLYIENTDKNNNPVTKDSNKLDRNIAKTNNVYIPGSIDPKADTSGLFTEIFRNIVPLENKDDSNSEYSGGEIFSYDVSNLPDGLIKIDVWAVDMTGNSGEDLEKGGKFYNNYDNGFKSIFVVKDTTPIDSAEVKAKKQVKSNSAQAPYYWYNKNTINKMNLFDTPENKIHDAGHPKLRALDKNLWWTFKVGNVTEKISAAANDIWKRIHDETTGETSIPYSLSDAQAPAKDGPVDITLYLKDDLGNLSEPVLLDSIMYDNTEPTVTLKNGKGDFINAKGEPVQNNSRDDEIEQILKVDFTENNAENNVDAVSGIRQMEIHISKNGVEVPSPLNDSFKVLYVPSTVANPTPETSKQDGLREIKIAQNDSATTKNKVVFDVDDSSKITSGTFFIYGLTLGDTDGPWTVSVNLFDSALNPAESIATTIMKRDTTPPVIEKIFVNDAQKRQVYNDTTKDSWWMPKSRYDSNGQYYNVTFDIYVNETGSGLKFIKLPKNVDIDFTDNTKLSADGINLEYDKDYSFDSKTNTITMLDEFVPKFINTEGSGNKIHFTLEDVKLNVNDSASGNKAGIEVEDFVDNITENTTLTYSDKSTGTLIFTDTKAPEITDLRIEDSEKNGDNNPDDIAYNNQYTGEDDISTKYTDDQTVTLLLTLEPETVSGSGVKTVHLSENAEFTSDTEIEVDGKLLPESEWSRSDNKSITFKKVFIEANKLKFKNVKLDSSVNGEQFIYAYLTDFAGLDTQVSKKSLGIIYDDVQPKIKKIDWVVPQFVAKGSANGNTVEDQTFQIDFKEVTSGVKVIKFDINYKPVDGEEVKESYATPFDLSNFEIKYGDKLLTENSDYKINGKYIILNTPFITENGDNGTFNFDNIKLCDTKAEGNYTIYVTLLDAAENINPQKETEGAVYKEEIVIDTTSPVVEKVQVIGAKKREVYGNPSDTHKWWMPKESSPNVKLDVTINESGSSIQKITVSEDVEFTPETKLYLKKSGKYLIENNDYILDRSENTITLLDKFFAEKLIRNDNENQFILENVKLKKANTLDGNKVALGLKDFVRNEGSNQIGTDYTIYFEEDRSTEQGTLVYLDSEKPEVAELKIKDSEQNDDNNPDIKAWDKDNYTDNDCVVLTLKLKAESENDGSGVKKITLSNNAKFAPNGASVIKVDGTTLNINQDYKFIAESEVEFTKVFTGNEEIEFTDIQLPSDAQGKQNVKVYLTDFVSLESEIASSNDVVYDNVSPRINKIEWTSDDSTVSLTNSESNKIENKTLNIDFTEETAGVKVIKFDITHGENTYDKPFEEGDFELIFTKDGKQETITDYTIDNRYIELTKPLNSGKLSFNNLKLNNAPDEGQYIINVTLLDAAENKNAQTDSSIYNCPISIDTTAPVIERVDVLDAIDRTEYNDSTNTATWWMPADKFESAESLSKVDLKVTINEIGSGIRYIKLSEDAEFTDNTVLTRVDGNVTLDNPKDYKLVDTHTIELLNPNNPKLNGTAGNPIVIKLANVKLNNINKAEGNKVKVEVEDFVYHTHTNAVTDGYKIYYDEKDYSGLLVYADYTKPVISELKIVDSEQAANVNPDAKGVDSENYTDNENVVLYLTIKAETLSHGSGVNKITLADDAEVTGNTEIFADNTKLESGYTISDDNHTVTFSKVFTTETVIKFTNVKFVNATNDNLNQTITAKLTDFVGLTSEEKSDAIVFDKTPADITKLEWVAPEGVAKGSANTNEVTDQTFKVTFTEAAAGVKVIKFDVTYDGDQEDSPSYDSPFSMTNFKLYYGDAELTSVTDYTIEDGRYIVLTNPKTTGSFTFENLKLRNASAEGEYNIKVTLLDAAENRNWNANTSDVKYNKKIFIDTTAPVVEKVLVEDAQKREVYNNASDSQQWWMSKEKFDGEDLSKVSLQITVNEAGSGLKLIKLSQDVEFTNESKLKKGTEYLAPGTEYTLDTTNNTITLLNYENPKLRGSANEPAVVFTLENVKLNNLNTATGNKIAVTVEDFVTNPGSNKIDGTENFKVYYPDGTDGTLIFADSEKPSITTLKIEDSAQNTVTNPDNKAWDKEKYTDSQNVILTLKLTAETTYAGSGIKVIQLKNNAEFTENTVISVDDTELTTGFTFAEDKKSVEFDKVFVAANVIKFTNVKLPATEGTYSINADVKDFAGWNAASVKVSDNSILLDTTNPTITKVNWKEDNDTVTAGTTNTAVVGNQSLQVAFTETLSGVKVIKFDITSENSSTPYAYPFGDESLSVIAGDETLKGSDYIFAGKYIILTTPVKSNTLSFHGIKLAETAEECVYTIKVTLLDAAENRALDTKTIAIDVTKPVIDGELRIPNLIHSVELSTGSTANEKYWLPQSYVNATETTGQAPSKIPVYLTIKERTSGVKIFTFSNDVVLTNAVLYKIDDTASDETASDARTEISSDEYGIDNDAHTITIREEAFAKDNFSKKNDSNEEVPFIILVDNIGFKNADSTSTASENSISITLSDVAKNVSEPKSTSQTYIYSDSIAPAAPTSFTIKDRGNSPTSGTISASSGYTNESIVDMTFNLSASEQYGSGYHKFTLTGATFKSSESDATSITIRNGTSSSSTPYSNLEWEIEDDGRTLVLKKSGAPDLYAVLKNDTTVSVTINNVHLDNPSTQGQHTVTLTAKDLTGWASSATTGTIKLDIDKPELQGGSPFTANYTSGPAYYNPAVNVYPHANEYGMEVISGTETIYTFYTATTYETGYYQYNGVVSEKSSTVASEPDTDFTHGAVLGFHAKDNLMLRASQGTSYYFMKYIANSNLNEDKEYIIQHGTDLRPDAITHVANSAESNKTDYDYTLWYKFVTGKYSAVILDAAGNVSDVFRFAVVQDTKPPVVTGMQNRVLLQRPDESANIYRNEDFVVSTKSTAFDYYPYTFDTSSNDGVTTFRNKKYVTKKSKNNYQIILNLGNTYTQNLASKMDGTDVPSVIEYDELKPTASSSPIESYAISTWYGSWPTSNDSTEKYTPVVPWGTIFPSGQALKPSAKNDTLALMACNYFGGNSSFKSYWRMLWSDDHYKNGVWPLYSHEASINEDKINKIKSYVDEQNNLIIEVPNTSTAPISVFLRDGCGNMNYIVLGLDEDNQIAVSFDIDDKFAWSTTDEYGKVENPFIIQAPYSEYNEETRKYDFGIQSGNATQIAVENGHDGVGEKPGFIKDLKKKATYYNLALSGKTLTQQPKLGLAMHFYEAGKSNTEYTSESVVFNNVTGTETASTSDVVAGRYTLRALLYCTTETGEPSYKTIADCLAEEKNKSTSEKTGQVTDWTYVKVGTETNEALIFLDYPRPDYKKLGWDKNNGPLPYYIWYIVEDHVGNYEIAKVVNSQVKDKTQTATNPSTIFDKWLYDCEGPVLKINGTDVKVNELGTSKAENAIGDLTAQVRKLVAWNNGYVPYLKDNKVYVHVDNNITIRDTSLKNETLGTGTTRWVEGADYSETVNGKNREYNPFVDLEVSELTGVRAFAWSKGETPPAYENDSVLSEGNTQGDNTGNKWYAGYGKTTINDNIGSSYTTTNYAKTAYYTSSEYSGTYSGTKVNTIIPAELLSTSTPLYLHVMDWTGNISTHRIGGYNGGNTSGLSFENDKTYPTFSSTTTVSHEDGKYDVRYQNSVITVRIANIKEDVKVRFKSSTGSQLYYSDTGSDYAGFSFENFDVNTTDNKLNIGNDTYGPYLLIPSTTYNTDAWKSGTTKTVYFYDNVGNTTSRSIKFIYDKVAPKLKGLTLNLASGGIIADEDGATKVSDTPKSYNFDDNANEELTPDTAGFSCKEVYVNEDKKVKIGITLDSNTTDFDHFEISKWSGTTWEKTSNLTTGSTSDTSTDSLKFADNETSAFFKITAYDYSGNAGSQYLRLILDKTAPVITIDPVITLGKGSINNIGETYYYTADTENPLTVTFAVEDSGVGVKNSTYKYSTDGTNYKTIDDNSKVEIKYTSGDVNKIWLKDCLDNAKEYTPGFKYTYNYIYSWITTSTETVNDGQGGTYEVTKEELHTEERSETKTITSLSFRDGTAPAAPTFNYSKARNLVQTYGVKNNSTEKEWRNSFIEKLTLKENTQDVDYVLIKNKEESKVRIKFTPAADSKIIGYVTSTSSDVGAYNFGHGGIGTKDDSGAIWVETDISEISRDNAFTVDYYAVDVVGNVSTTPLSVRYTFDNPHAAKNVTLIRDPLNSTEIPEDVRTEMEKDNLNFASFWDKAGDVNDKKGITWFSDGYLVIKCTLYQKPGDDYSETPTKVTLHDKYMNGWYDPPREESPERGVSDTGELFKWYTSSGDTEKDASGRYYCWIAFKLKTFDNNDSGDTDYGGSKIHASVHGKESKSDLTILNPESTKGYGWKRDVTAPEITNGNGKTYLSNNVLTNYDYNSSSKSMALVYDQDNDKGGDYVTVAYDRGLKIYIRADNIFDKDTDNKKTGFDKYRFDYNGSSNDWNNLKTVSSKGTTYYEFALPGVESVHSNLILMLKDKVGNVSSYKLAHTGKTESYRYVWWIANDILTTEGTLPNAKIEAQKVFEQTDESYTFDVTLPYGSIIKSVKAKVGKQNDYNETGISQIKFNDYKGSSVTLDGNKGWLNVNGLTVTLPKIEQKWHAQDVVIIVNDTVTLKNEGFIPVRTLTADDIKLKLGESQLTGEEKVNTGTYTLTIDAPVTINSVSNETPDFNGFGWNSQSPNVITLTNVTQDWNEKEIKVNINGVSKKVFTVNLKNISNGDLSVESTNYVAGTNEYTLTIGTSTGAPLSRINLITPNIGSVADDWTYDSETNKITATLTTVAQKLTPQPVKLSFNGTNVNQNVTAKVFDITARELTLDDLDITPSIDENGVHKVSVTIKEDGVESTLIENSELIVTNAEIDGEIIREGSKLTFALKNISEPDWDDNKWVTLKVKELTPMNLFKIDCNEIAENDIKVTSAKEEETYTITIESETGAPLNRITLITADHGTIAENGWSYDANTKKITATIIPDAKKLTQQIVTLSFTGNKVQANLKKDAFVIEARALASTDLDVSHSVEDGIHKVTVTINEEEAPNTLIEDADLLVTGGASIDGDIIRNGNTISFALKDIPEQDYEPHTVNLKVKDFDSFELISIAAKAFTINNINVEVGQPTGNVYPLTITTTDNAPINLITKIEGINGTVAEDWTVSDNTITTSLTAEEGKNVSLKFNESDDFIKENVVTAATNKFIIDTVNGELKYTTDYPTINIKILKTDGTIESIELVSENLKFSGNSNEWNGQVWDDGDYNKTNFSLEITKLDEPTDAVIKVNGISITLFQVPAKETANGTGGNQGGTADPGSSSTDPDGSDGSGQVGGTLNPTSRSIFGARASTSAYTTSAVETVSEPVKTRRVSLTSWVTDLFNNDSEVVTETVKDEVKATTTKAAKKAKKAQKASAAKVEKAPVEKPVVTETVESVAVTETVENAANVEEAAPEAKVTMTSVDASVTESVAEDEPQSGAILWLALAALCAAVAGVVVLILKNRTAKK